MKRKSNLKGYTWKTFLLEIIMLLLCCIIVLPFYYLVISIFKTPREMGLNPLGLPESLYLENFKNAWAQIHFVRAFFNTLLITFSTLIVVILFGSMSAYAVARRKSRFYKLVMLYFLLGFMVPFQTTMVPLYQQMAIIDGAGPLRVFFQITVPLLKPITVTMTIFHVMGTWNDFVTPFLFLHTRNNATLMLEMYRGVGEFQSDWPLMMTTMVLIMAPLVIFYIFAQRYIIDGLTNGAVKG